MIVCFEQTTKTAINFIMFCSPIDVYLIGEHLIKKFVNLSDLCEKHVLY